MDYMILCGTAILAVVLILFFKQLKSNYALPLATVFGIILMRQALKNLAPELSFFNSITEKLILPRTGNIILKIFGISMIVETTADICRDANENTIASKIELIGKVEILIITLPLIKEILKIIESLMLN